VYALAVLVGASVGVAVVAAPPPPQALSANDAARASQPL
jgi:hypothetical protein